MNKPFPYLLLLLLLLPQTAWGQTPEPVVHAVIFYSPTCPHCHQVITEHLIPLQNQYGSRLVVFGMDTSQGYANNLYWEAIREYEIPEENWAVPLLVVGGEAMVGGIEIPSRFPTILEEGLASGGIDLPDFQAFQTFLREEDLLDPRFPDRLIARQDPPVGVREEEPVGDTAMAGEDAPQEGNPGAPPSDTAEVVSDTSVISGDSLEGAPEVTREAPVTSERDTARVSEAEPAFPGPTPDSGREIREEAAGEEPGLAGSRPEQPREGAEQGSDPPVGLEQVARELESMTMWDRFRLDPTGNSFSVVVLLGMILSLAFRGYPPRVKEGEWPSWVIPGLVLAGALVAGYLSYVELTHAAAVCGPVGDCNAVNQSEYAVLFGFLPVGVLGLLGYGGILALWLMRVLGPEGFRRRASLGLWAGALLGTLFSVYLTFLEPFVIGATCAWCLTSAVVMTLLLWATAPSAARAWRIDGGLS